MARKISVSQFKSMIRQAEAKQKKAINDYNRKVRDHNRKANRAVDDYNRAARSYNAKVRSNQQRLKRELARLARGATARSTIHSSSRGLYQTFTQVESRVEAGTPSQRQARFLDLSERETANSVAVLNALDGTDPENLDDTAVRLKDTAVKDELRLVSEDLDRRWRGALFALDPRNPDAGRHFCTSAREVFTRFLELHATDDAVFRALPECDRAHDGRPTRRSRIKLLLLRGDMAFGEFEEFVALDVQNVLDLFQVFNDGTHGSAGKYSLPKLLAVKQRVEDGILFLANLVQ